ncbi:hypothetical protein MNEG_3027 [Monoraphidium neglectum]|uniref:PH domain-containing protein n=1 Tax=Monoraphidium neglectum TaxID=145388 RepID=A0A0D2NJ52_9CHLO|nr:hypothetical protein MNEG_3027 [Monoraphidium neglectum]KIZ04936.1 hypothetical protein MNEG_3027 [Monoraphidium neglectum]|eukprot:XP_013903955.1 hypothetical protein MNEG_3027 [Monoraphidium neglectum]
MQPRGDGGFVPLAAVYDEWAAIAVCAAAAIWAVPHLQLWLLPSLPVGAALLLLVGGAVGACCLAGLLPAQPQRDQERASDAPPARAPDGVASFGPLLRARERYGGRIWTVAAADWRRASEAEAPQEFPPRSFGEGAVAMQWSGRLRGASLRLLRDGPGAPGQPEKARVSLAGCGVRVASECLRGSKGTWWKKGPLEIRHPDGRPLLAGCSTLFLFAPDGAAKEQWHSALLWACGDPGDVRRAGALYSAFCRDARARLAAAAAPEGGSDLGWRTADSSAAAAAAAAPSRQAAAPRPLSQAASEASLGAGCVAAAVAASKQLVWQEAAHLAAGGDRQVGEGLGGQGFNAP